MLKFYMLFKSKSVLYLFLLKRLEQAPELSYFCLVQEGVRDGRGKEEKQFETFCNILKPEI